LCFKIKFMKAFFNGINKLAAFLSFA